MLLYSFFISLLRLGFTLGALFNEKIAKGKRGRTESVAIIRKAFSTDDEVIWMHAASLGEYEQGLPVLEELKEAYPNYKTLITFFSPSGYEVVARKKHPADAICYLPFDEKGTMETFVGYFQPRIFFTVKYDYWYHLLSALKRRNCRTFAVATNFYPQQLFFRLYGKWAVAQLKKSVDFFFHQTQKSLELAQSIGLNNGMVSGDTRFDRVRYFLERNNEVPHLQAFINGKKAIVFGSSWQGEEEVLEELSSDDQLKFIIAPHDLSRVEALKKQYPSAILYSSIAENPSFSKFNVLIIDCIGLLNKLYAYADLAVVGGGFHTKGLHNILEAAVYGKPVFFGNRYKKNPEADDLIAFGGAKSCSTPQGLARIIQSVLCSEQLERMSQKSALFVSQQPHATRSIVQKIKLELRN